MNCVAVGLLFHPPDEHIAAKNNSKWSWPKLYVNRYVIETFVFPTNSLNRHSTLLIATRKPRKPVLRFVFTIGVPQESVRALMYCIASVRNGYHACLFDSHSGLL